MISRTGQRIAPPRSVITAARSLLVGILAGALLPATSAYAAHKLSRDESRTIDVHRETGLLVKNSRGKTLIVGKRGTSELVIRASKFVRAESEQSANERMENLTFLVDTDGRRITITTEYPNRAEEEGSFWSFLRGIRYKAVIDYTIEVPSGFDVEVSSASGDVQITSIDGNCAVYGSSGDVLLKNIGGGAFVEVSSGDVQMTDVSGQIQVQSSSGDAMIRDAGSSIKLVATSGDMEAYKVVGSANVELASGNFTLDGCDGDVTSRTASGNAVLKDVLGSVRAFAGSGDVTMNIFPVGDKQFLVNTASGDVSVVFATPERYGFKLDVSTASGSIEGDLDIRLDKVSRRVLRGVVGTGDARLVIETGSGNIVVRQAGISR